MNEKPWMLPKGQTIWYEGQAIDPYEEIAMLRAKVHAPKKIITKVFSPGQMILLYECQEHAIISNAEGVCIQCEANLTPISYVPVRECNELMDKIEVLNEQVIAALRAQVEALTAECEAAEKHIDHMAYWCSGSMAGLTNRGVADAVMRMCDDYLPLMARNRKARDAGEVGE